jgi:hypothetical protein
MTRKQLEKAGLQALKDLRRNKLDMGFPFMININTLPPGQCYMEYPDGTIKLVTIDRDHNDFKVITELSSEDVSSFRKKHKLD